MKITHNFSNKISQILKPTVTISLGLLAVALIAGCSADYGRIRWDEDITRSFKTHQVQTDYNYYYYGIGMRVFAVVGLDPELEMQSRIWRELSPDTEELTVAISRIWDNPYYAPYHPRGAYIVNPAGEKVGVYYSSLIYVTTKFESENRVSIIPDTAFLWGPDSSWTP